MLRLYSPARKFDTVFIVLLFVLFAFTAGLLVMIGANQYHVTATSIDKNYEVRTASSYLTEKMHQYDSSAGISVTDSALVFSENLNDMTYLTYVYYYDGYLCELLISSDMDFNPEAGAKIMPLNGFHAEELENSLIRVSFTDSDGFKHQEYLHYHTAAGKETS